MANRLKVTSDRLYEASHPAGGPAGVRFAGRA